jgi:hypothetical protein
MVFLSSNNDRHPVPKTFTLIHYTSYYFTTLHVTSLHFIPIHYTSYQFTTLHTTSLHFMPLYYTCWHFTSSHLNFTHLHFTTLHYPLIWLWRKTQTTHAEEIVDKVCDRLEICLKSILARIGQKVGVSALYTKPQSVSDACTAYHNCRSIDLRYWLCRINVFGKLLSSHSLYRAFKLKVGHQLSREYFTADAFYNGSAGMTLYYYMCWMLARLLQERGEPVLAFHISWISRQWVLVFK